MLTETIMGKKGPKSEMGSPPKACGLCPMLAFTKVLALHVFKPTPMKYNCYVARVIARAAENNSI